jgi:hypothetical protein
MRTQYQHPFWLNPLYTTVDFSGIISTTLSKENIANDYNHRLKVLVERILHDAPTAIPHKKTSLPKHWGWPDIQTLVQKADEIGYASISTAVLIAHETGQPYEKILTMQHPRDYENGIFTCYHKTNKKLFSLPVSPVLRARLSSIPRSQLLLCPCEDTGGIWDSVVFLHILQSLAHITGLSLKAAQIKT